MAIIVMAKRQSYNFLFNITGGGHLFFFRLECKARKLQEVISEQERPLSLYSIQGMIHSM